MSPADHGEPREATPAEARNAGSRVDAGAKTQSGPLGRIDPKHPVATPDAVPRPPLATATALVVAAFAVLVGTLFVFGKIAEGVREQEVFALDTWATPFLHSISSPPLDTVMTGFTTMGSGLVLIPIFVLVTLALALQRRFGAAAFFAVASGGAMVLDATMKVVFQRPRPKLDYAAVLPDYSFPSGHSMNGVVFYIGLALIAWSIFGRRVGVVAVGLAAALALGIGLSRIYLGYHYLTDVVGGFLAGAAWLAIVLAIFRIRPNVWEWRSESARRSKPERARR